MTTPSPHQAASSSCPPLARSHGALCPCTSPCQLSCVGPPFSMLTSAGPPGQLALSPCRASRHTAAASKQGGKADRGHAGLQVGGAVLKHRSMASWQVHLLPPAHAATMSPSPGGSRTQRHTSSGGSQSLCQEACHARTSGATPCLIHHMCVPRCDTLQRTVWYTLRRTAAATVLLPTGLPGRVSRPHACAGGQAPSAALSLMQVGCCWAWLLAFGRSRALSRSKILRLLYAPRPPLALLLPLQCQSISAAPSAPTACSLSATSTLADSSTSARSGTGRDWPADMAHSCSAQLCPLVQGARGCMPHVAQQSVSWGCEL